MDITWQQMTRSDVFVGTAPLILKKCPPITPAKACSFQGMVPGHPSEVLSNGGAISCQGWLRSLAYGHIIWPLNSKIPLDLTPSHFTDTLLYLPHIKVSILKQCYLFLKLQFCLYMSITENKSGENILRSGSFPLTCYKLSLIRSFVGVVDGATVRVTESWEKEGEKKEIS